MIACTALDVVSLTIGVLVLIGLLATAALIRDVL